MSIERPMCGDGSAQFGVDRPFQAESEERILRREGLTTKLYDPIDRGAGGPGEIALSF